ncbi:MAG: LysR family transcriptional regulator [Henriciella sp.]
MELKWLEDLVSVVEKGHFARAAEARNITQSAFSRRIKALEIWAGTELLDRSQHPVTLTSAGRNFISHAQDIIRLANEARTETMGFSRLAETGVTIACLHTLALFHVPSLLAELKNTIGSVEATIVAETRTVEEYLESLFSGASDFFICYRHPAFSFDIDLAQFPRLDIGSDRILPYIRREDFRDDLLEKTGPTIPYLEYSGTSFMSRVVDHTVKQAPFRKRLKSVYRGTLAESLCTAAINGLGMAWLPESVVASNPRSDALRCVSVEAPEHMQISIFSAANNKRPIVQRILAHLREKGAR